LPWDDESFPQSRVDCYEEFYDLTVTPRVRFDPAADLEICQLDPGAEGNPNAPSPAVLARLELFTKDVDNVVRILANPDEVSDANAICIDDNIEHAIGPIDWSRSGRRNALARLERFGSRAFRLFRPTTLYADNVPTHGDIFGELLFGNVVGAIDRGARVEDGSVILSYSDPTFSQEDQISTAGDVTGVQLVFDLDDGTYQVTWNADPARPFNGNLRLNLNLGNTRLGGDLVPLFGIFENVESQTQLSYSGTAAALTTWQVGDIIVSAGDEPQFVTSFNSALVDLDDISLSNRDFVQQITAEITRRVTDPVP
jgi:hypothetical protein